MTNFGDKDRVDNGLEATEIGIGDPGTKQRADVDPEGVEGGQTESDLLAHAKGTGLGFIGVRVQGGSGGSDERLGDEVGVDGNGTIVGHALHQFDESDLNDASVCCWRALARDVDTYSEDPPWNHSGHTGESSELLGGGEVI